MPRTDARSLLTPESALEDCLARHLRPGMRVTVGFSGGIDSMALLHACQELRSSPLAHVGVEAIHIHHGLSPWADDWVAFCLETARNWSIPCQVVRVEVERGTPDGLEAAARRARHHVFATLDADRVLLAHHRDDQAETVLFNLLRGTGLAGAAAMAESSNHLLRPWLGISRASIVSYARQHGLCWIEDDSNLDTRFSRNFLRHQVFPVLATRFPAGSGNLAKAAERFAEAEHLLDELALIDLQGAPAGFPLAIEIIRKLDAPRARNLLRYLLRCQDVAIPSAARLTEAVRQMCDALPDKHPVIVLGRYRLQRRGGQIHLLLADRGASR